MRYLASALIAAAALTGGPALANVCHAGKLLCATTMPVGGFCECTARGGPATGGTVMSRAPAGMRLNAMAGGCGAHPAAPGCH